MADINSILDLEKCIPNRGNLNLNWEVLERNNQAKRRSENKRVLPLSIMVKIKGPPKVLDPYRLTKSSADIDQDRSDDSSPGTSCTPLNLLGSSPTKLSPSPDKHALPMRPAILQSKQIPGRFFPKAGAIEDHRMMVGGNSQTPVQYVSKPAQRGSILTRKNLKPGITRSYDFNKSKAEATNMYNEKILRQRKSLFEQNKDRNSMMTISYFNPETQLDKENKQSDQSTYFSVQRFLSSSRHVSVPGGRQRFGDVLKGTPKAIHFREDALQTRLASLSARNSAAHVQFEEPETDEVVATASA
ncbi:hypothetical protein KP79_PYT06385 [Mizuhopecten yessoensis]|uniref:Uncharacterized protein n=1 Tax=Mizuhopecten yessoensis TaxID=6573 RepID=A0A210QWX3_MIZYE|nr:hypothetical protein KP79_PYT06385 [Mizuhopecten yessoensis]